MTYHCEATNMDCELRHIGFTKSIWNCHYKCYSNHMHCCYICKDINNECTLFSEDGFIRLMKIYKIMKLARSTI
jgi:hypothetical protein